MAVDVNSSYGLYLLAFAFDSEVRLVAQRVFKPPNTTMLKLLVAVMRSYSELGSWELAVKRFRERRSVRRLQRGERLRCGGGAEACREAESEAKRDAGARRESS